MHALPCVLSKRMHKEESWQELPALGVFVVLFCGSDVHDCTSTSMMCIKSEMNIYRSPHIHEAYLWSELFGWGLKWQYTGKTLCADGPACIHAESWECLFTFETHFKNFKTKVVSTNVAQSSFCVLSEPRQSSLWLRWMIVCIGRHAMFVPSYIMI